MTTITVRLSSASMVASGIPSSPRALLSCTEVTFAYRRAHQTQRRHLPSSIDAGQAYYWARAWQRDQNEVLDELDGGAREEFATADDAIRWLLSAVE